MLVFCSAENDVRTWYVTHYQQLSRYHSSCLIKNAWNAGNGGQGELTKEVVERSLGLHGDERAPLPQQKNTKKIDLN